NRTLYLLRLRRFPIRPPVRLCRYRQRQHDQRQQQRQFPVLAGHRFEAVPPRSLQFDKEQTGPARSALAPALATIPELKFVPRSRKARLSPPSSPHLLAFLKRSPELPLVRRLPIRAPVRLGKCLQRMRPPPPVPPARWPAHHAQPKQKLLPRAQSLSRHSMAPARLPVRRIIPRNRRRLVRHDH